MRTVRRSQGDISAARKPLLHSSTAPDSRSFTKPDEVAAQSQVARQVWSALDRLPFDQRTILVLREIDGLSYEEIGYSLGVAVGTVKSRLARAREHLRDALRQVKA